MSNIKRKNLKDSKESSSDNDSEISNGSEESNLMGEDSPFEVQVDFEGRSPIDPDHAGISQLLQRVFLKAHINCEQMADLIIAQNFVGSVIVQWEGEESESESDDDMCESGTIFGITSILNITAKKDTPCIAQLRSFLLSKAEKHATDAALKQFRNILNNNDTRQVGYLINERFINIPTDVSVPLLDNLNKEIETAHQKGMKFSFDYYLMILKFHRKEAKRNKEKEDIYVNVEEELISAVAINSFEWSVVEECDTGEWSEGDATLTPYRKVIIFDAKELPERITYIANYIKDVQ